MNNQHVKLCFNGRLSGSLMIPSNHISKAYSNNDCAMRHSYNWTVVKLWSIWLFPNNKMVYLFWIETFCLYCSHSYGTSMREWCRQIPVHYDDVIMGLMASQITSLTIVYSTVDSGADQSKHQSSASLAFVWGIHRGPVTSPHKWPVTRKMLPFDDVIMTYLYYMYYM